MSSKYSMSLSDSLTKLGLTKNEAIIYEYLLRNGISSPAKIARATRIARPNTYYILDNLLEKSLITVIEKGKSGRKQYAPQPPRQIFLLADRLKQESEQLLPELESIYNPLPTKPEIRLYEGLAQIKQLYQLTLATKDVYAIGSLQRLEEADKGFFVWYQKQLVRYKIGMHEVTDKASTAAAASVAAALAGGVYEQRIVEKLPDHAADILVSGDRVAIVILTAPYIGILVRSPHVAAILTFLIKESLASIKKSV